MTININDKEITLKHTFRSYIIYETITGKSFEPKTVTDILTYFYSVVMASEPTAEITFDNFIDWIDQHEDQLSAFVSWLTQQQRLIDNFAGTDRKGEPAAKGKKKK